MDDRTVKILSLTAAITIIAGGLMPEWAVFLVTVSTSYGVVVLGMMLLVRTGLVSFGHGLYYCLGAYTAGILRPFFGITDFIVMLICSTIVSGMTGFVLGFLLRKYRNIFFAMLSLAFSMILYGLISKSSSLGSTDGFNVTIESIFGVTVFENDHVRYMLLILTVTIAWLSAVLIHFYLKSDYGKLVQAIRDNELRVEYLGISVRNVIHFNYVVSAILAGIGGALVAISIGHIDPEMTYWTTSGEFVFITIMAGSGSVIAPFLGAAIFETIRSFAYEYSPNTWQLLLGSSMLVIIIFLPEGLWSLSSKLRGQNRR